MINWKKKQIVSKFDFYIVDFLLKPEARKEYLDQFLYLLNKLMNGYKHDNIRK